MKAHESAADAQAGSAGDRTPSPSEPATDAASGAFAAGVTDESR